MLYATWVTPLGLVREKNATIRLCRDYRSAVNAAVKKSCSLLQPSEVLASLRGGGTAFSILNLFQAYQQVKFTEDTAAVLTINIIKGLYHVKCLQLGISAALAVFQCFVETTVTGIPDVSALLNDIDMIQGDACDDDFTQMNKSGMVNNSG